MKMVTAKIQRIIKKEDIFIVWFVSLLDLKDLLG